MSFMPNPGSTVRLLDGRLGIVSNVTPKGDDDRVTIDGVEEPVTAWDIAEIIDEPDLPAR